jgi:hypothetical protein
MLVKHSTDDITHLSDRTEREKTDSISELSKQPYTLSQDYSGLPFTGFVSEKQSFSSDNFRITSEAE